MTRLYFLYFIILLFSNCAYSQNQIPLGLNTNHQPIWGASLKSNSDSCGFYYNNYIGLAKTSNVRIESMRKGNALESNHYNGRAQKFSSPQPIEIGGVEFYAFIDNNPNVDSIMVITTLNNYNITLDSIGLELARDTVYVKHTNYNPSATPLPNIAVQSYFKNNVTVTAEYMISIVTPTDDSLKIIASDPFKSDGNGEDLSYALYDNINYSSYHGWYDIYDEFSSDYDYLISPLVNFEMHNGLTIIDTLFCVDDDDNVCLTYHQNPIFISHQYYANGSKNLKDINVNWNDGNTDADTTSFCHTYTSDGTYTINVKDIFYKWHHQDKFCDIDISNSVINEDPIILTFSYTQVGMNVSFTSNLVNTDSIWWDFGDGSNGTNNLNPTHLYTLPGNYGVWLHGYNDCMNSSIFKSISVEPLSIKHTSKQLLSFSPNPANKFISFTSLPVNSTLTIYNIVGKNVMTKTIKISTQILNVDHLPNGTYFVKLIDENKIITKKLIIVH